MLWVSEETKYRKIQFSSGAYRINMVLYLALFEYEGNDPVSAEMQALH